MPTVSITEEEWAALSAFKEETANKAENANDEYVEWFNRHNEHFRKLQKKFKKAKIKQETKAIVKKALK